MQICMGMTAFVRSSPPLSIALQARFLQAAQPGSSYRFTGRSGLIWRGSLRPTPLSEQYKLRVSYTLGHYPETTVLEPKLKSRGNELIPHMYEQTTLCLFNPHKGEWTPHMRLSETILPLASLWLYFYDIWFATGGWEGGGDHPQSRRDPPQATRPACIRSQDGN